MNKIDAPKEILTLHGSAPAKKPNGIVWLIYENVNGLSNKLTKNKKVEWAKEIHGDLEVNIITYNEHQLNMERQWLQSFVLGGEAEICSILAHNVHKNIGWCQQGRTSLMLFGPLIEQLNMDQSGKDIFGLGRWMVMTLQGVSACTCIAVGYIPCRNNTLDSGTVYQQHRQFFITQGKNTSCPWKLFSEDLVAKLRKWWAKSNHLIICLNANEDIYKKSIGKALTSADGLSMKEVVGEFTGKKIGPTYIRGSKLIDGVWVIADVEISNTCIMPTIYGIGNNRKFIVDIVQSSLIGEEAFRVHRLVSCWLNTKTPGSSAAKYIATLESLLARHCLIEQLG
jgi:hypothetical protein